ncbi:MAG: YkgJ family cysteine cluster protein [Desulfobaccales bacterium]
MAKQARRSRGVSERRPVSRVDQSIAAAARDNVVAIVGQGRVAERALEIAASAFYLTDHLTGRFEAENPLPQPIACEARCDACCYNQVELTPPEALLIGHHIEEYFHEAAKDLLLAHVARIMQLTAGKGKAEIAARRGQIPCPLLAKRTCSIYPIRSLVCRAMHGLDREGCEAELRAGSLAASRYYAHRHEIAVSVSAGVLEGCREVGCQATTLNLTRALHDFFAQENPVERWINGEDVFKR